MLPGHPIDFFRYFHLISVPPSGLFQFDYNNLGYVLIVGLITYPLPHQPPHFELHSSFRWYFNGLHCLLILCHSWRPSSDFEDAEVAEFQAVALGEFKDYFIEKLMYYCLDSYMLAWSLLCDSIYKFNFCYCCH